MPVWPSTVRTTTLREPSHTTRSLSVTLLPLMCWARTRALSATLRPDASLSTSASERMDVNQILGSDGLGLYSPRAMDSMRARICSCGRMPMTMDFMMF
mgnify:CR=1 FL=1